MKRCMKGLLVGLICSCVAAGAQAEDWSYWYGTVNQGLSGSLTDNNWLTYTNDYNSAGGDSGYPGVDSSAYVQSGNTTLSSGQTFQVANFSVGRGWGGYATNSIAGGTLTVTNDTTIGHFSDGHGWFLLSDGTVTLKNLYVAYDYSPDGHLIQSGGTITVSGDETWIGNGSGAVAEWTMTDGTYTGGSVFLGRNASTATWNMSGGTVVLNNTSNYGAMSAGGWNSTPGTTINLSDSAQVTMNGDFYLIRAGESTATVSESANLQVNGSLYIGADANCATGKLEVAGGTVTVTSAPYIGNNTGNSGTVEVTGGTLTIDADEMFLGCGSGATGTLTVSAGTLNGKTIHVGREAGGTGLLNISGGKVTLDNTAWYGALNASWNATSTGTINISGDADVDVTGTVNVPYDGTGALNVSNGVLNVDGVINFGVDNSCTGVVTLAGGTLTTSQLISNYEASDTYSAKLVFDGGTLAANEANLAFITNVAVSVTDNGAIIENDYDVTVYPVFTAATDATAPFVTKKGLGVLTLASEYTFSSFKVDLDLDSADIAPGTYTLVKGLGSFSENSITTSVSSSSQYDATFAYDSGTLSVTLAYKDNVAYVVNGDFNQSSTTIDSGYQAIVFSGEGAKLTGACDLSSSTIPVTIAGDAWLDLNGNDLTLGSYDAAPGAVITNSSETAATLKLGANNGVMSGNMYVTLGGNLTVSLEGATDTTGFNSSLTFTHTGGWYFKDNDYAIQIGSTHLGSGTVEFAGNGGFTPTYGKNGGVDDDNWDSVTATVVINGTGNTVDSTSKCWLWEFFLKAKVSGSGDLHVASGGNGIEINGNSGSDWSGFTGTLYVNVYALLFGTTQTMTNMTVCLDADGGQQLAWREQTPHLGDLCTDSAEYSSNPPTLGAWETYESLPWYIGYANKDSTFAGKINDITYTSGEETLHSSVDIHKVGTGTWTINGECENYGTFYVEGGRLDFDQTVANAGVSVAEGATLGGSGTLSGTTLTFASGAKIAASTTACLTAANADVDLTGVSVVVDDAATMDAPAKGVNYTVLTAKTITATGKVAIESTLPSSSTGTYTTAIVTNDTDSTQSLVLTRKPLGITIIVR